MIEQTKQKRAIKIIQDLIIIARGMAYEGKDVKLLAEFLDKVEYLPALMLEEKDRTDFFERYLIGICEDYNCPEVLSRNKL
ncbi:MAG: hypothetical protein MUC29_10375 [Pyrinomonadaceae bacterium]|nr:hypothetical protein [Pyrinomonadaceae bacterium]